MTQALKLGWRDTPSFGAGLLARLRIWLDPRQRPSEATQRQQPMAAPIGESAAAVRGSTPNPTPGALLLPFPIRGEALLVRLADRLRSSAANRPPAQDPFAFAISRQPRSRLTIDRDAYVEFLPERAAYQAVIEAAPDTTITIETTDFDSVVKFVAQYVTDRLSDPVAAEAAL
jgi:hypothetical protein